MAPKSGSRRIFVALIAALATLPVIPASTLADGPIFGPVTCQRGATAAPAVLTYTFPAPEPARGYILKVRNGGLEDTSSELVSSSTVSLNGSQILGPNDFNQNVRYLEAPVSLHATNTLEVEVRGKPGGAMIIEIYPFVVIDVPADGQVFNSQPISVSGHVHASAMSVSVNGLAAAVSGTGFSVPNVLLVEGTNAIVATATGQGGFVGSDRVDVVLDTQPPSIEIDSPEEGLVTNQTVAPEFRVADAQDPHPAVAITPEPPYTVEGACQMTIRATDWAGNQAEVTRRFVIDKSPPAIHVTSPVEGATMTASTVDISGSVDDPTARVTVNGTAVALTGSDFFMAGVGIIEGVNTIVIAAEDAAGNRAATALHVSRVLAPPTVSLSATRRCIAQGESTVLSWSSAGSSYLQLQPNVGAVAATGSITVSPYATTSYIIMAHANGYPAASAQVWITVIPPTLASFSANPADVPYGQSSRLSWQFGTGAPVRLEPGFGNQTYPSSYSMPVFPAETTTYTLTTTCPYPGGTLSRHVAVEVDRSTAKLPTVSIAADPMTIRPGDDVYLSWASTDAVTVDVDPLGREPWNGTAWVSPSETTTYTITGHGLAGDTTAQVTVTVIQPSPTVTFTASPGTIRRGESALLSWTSEHVSSASISPDVGDVATTGSIAVTPSETTTYALAASGPGGTVNATVGVTVLDPTPSASLSISPASVARGQAATLSWTSSNAATVEISPAIGLVAGNGSVVVAPAETTIYTMTATGAGGTATAREMLTVIQPLPTVAITATPDTVAQGQSAALSWETTGATSVSISPAVGSDATSGSAVVAPAQTTTYTAFAAGPGGTATATTTVTVIQPPGIVSILASLNVVNLGEPTTIYWSADSASTVLLSGGIGRQPAIGSITLTPTATTEYVAMVIAGGSAKVASTTVKVLGNVAPLSGGAFGSHHQDLVPADATLEAYDERRFALVTGLVVDAAHLPIAEVTVSAHGHPEFGTAHTDADGRFSLPVEGGGALTLAYAKRGYIPIHRDVDVPWNSIVAAETGTMLARDAVASVVAFDGNPASVFTHTGGAVTDERGVRASTLVFTGDDRAFAVVDGVETEIRSITVRATEFPKMEAMPAMLPPASAYTYCVDFSVDGVDEVRFEKPIIAFTDNFLGFPVGMAVPLGYYDYRRAAWVPSDNGVVVRLLDRDNDGTVDALDGTGDQVPDDLDGDGTYEDEVAGLTDPSRFVAGATYWRYAVTHFSPWDANWPFVPPADARPPAPGNEPSVDQQKPPEFSGCPTLTNSYVESGARIYHEDVPIAGTALTLHYASNRVPGYAATLNVPVSGETLPPGVKRIVTKLEVAGRVFETTSEPLPDQSVAFEWDGRDHLGRVVQDHTNARISIGYVYDAVYAAPGDFAQAFAQAGNEVTAIPTRSEVIAWKASELALTGKVSLRTQFSNALAKGWTLSNNHLADRNDPTRVYRGDGTLSSITTHTLVVSTVAGSSVSGYSGDGGSAPDATLDGPMDLAVDVDGSLFVCDLGNFRVRRIDTRGVIATVAGNGSHAGSGNDGGRATDASLVPLASAPDGRGNLYVAEPCRIRKVDPNGIISTVAGNGMCGYAGDGGPAGEARFDSVADIAVDNEGNVYVADGGNHRVRKIATNGIVETIAGNGVNGADGTGSVDNVPATSVSLDPGDIALGREGDLFVVDRSRRLIRRIDASGIMTTFAGNGGAAAHTGDGGPAADASIGEVTGIAMNRLGDVCFSAITRPGTIHESEEGRIRCIGRDGTIATIAGAGPCAEESEGREALASGLCWPGGIAIDPAGTVFYIENRVSIDLLAHGNDKVEKISYPREAGIVLSGTQMRMPQDDGEVLVFSEAGLHQSTLDMFTGAHVYDFGYSPEGALISVRDAFGRVLRVERDGTGTVTAIVSPDGIATYLDVDEKGHLHRVRYPDWGEYTFTYTDSGLMTDEYDPNGNRYVHAFDGHGRLTDVWGGGGEHQSFARHTDASGASTSRVANAYLETAMLVERTNGDGSNSVTTVGRDGSSAIMTFSADGKVKTTVSPCGLTTRVERDFDAAYARDYPNRGEVTLPSGRTAVVANNNTYEDADQDGTIDVITLDTSVDGKNWKRVHDLAARTITLRSPEDRSAVVGYEPAGLRASEIRVSGLLPTSLSYDEAGRLSTVSTGARRLDYGYDANGNLDFVRRPDGTYDLTYDVMGRLRHESRPDGGEVRYEYDANGNLTLVANPNAISFAFGYDPNNQRQSFVQPLSGDYRYFYDLDRRLEAVVAPSGARIVNTYAQGNLETTTTPEGTTVYDFLCGGRLGSASRNGEGVSFSYDGPLVETDTRTGTLAKSIGYAYNGDFAVSSLTYAGAAEGIAYDGDGLLTQVGGLVIARDPQNGLPLRVSGGGMVVARTFSDYGELDGVSWSMPGASLYDWTVTRDVAGKVSGRVETLGNETISWAYRYDAAGRLREVDKNGALVERYSYDLNGNRLAEMNALRGVTGRLYDHTIEDHVVTAGLDSYVFDVDGFLQSRSSPEGTTSYQYSSRGELLRVDRPDGTILSYVHDPFGRRIAKEVNGTIVEKYLWADRTTLLAVYDGGDNLLQRYAYADARVPVSMTAGGATYFLLTDQVGSLRAVADASGTIVKRIDYDTFGNIVGDSNPVFSVPFGFAGGLHDRDTGLVRFGYRDYAPELGRFTAKDPIDFAGGDTNLYAYVMNDPVNFVDPMGLWGEDVHYGMTYGWALSLGFTRAQAERIARADNGTDGGYGSWMPVFGDQSRHFNQGNGGCSDSRSSWAEKEFQRAIGYVNSGNMDAALGHLGRGLHSLQDIGPHRDWDTGKLGWSAHPDWYDSWNDPRNSAGRAMTEQRSLEYLSRFMLAVH